jgi:membrane protease YdiL (CAAX protease family)
MRAESAVPWGVRPIIIPTLAFVAVVVVGGLLAALWNPGGQSRSTAGLLLDVAGYAVIAAAIWYAGAPIARRHGGWAAAFGWSRPTAADARPVLPWFLANITARIVAGGLVVEAVPAWRHTNVSNVDLHGQPTTVIIGALIVVVVIAPPIEELWFRGLILRTFMRRFSFWPSAIACSFMFGLFHTYELATLAGAAQLGVSVAVFGLGQCILVRRHVGLNTAIGVHSLTNFLVSLLSLVVVTHS